jgi:hypothetical protein
MTPKILNRVYRHRPLAIDEHLGRVDPEGQVYESRLGPDKFVGQVNLNTGQIYENRVGPDKYIGRVDPETGRVYRSKVGPDEYLGRVTKSGKFLMHRRMARDLYFGKVVDMISLVHGGAAFLLLAFPILEEISQEEKAALESTEFDPEAEEDAGDAPVGGEASPA